MKRIITLLLAIIMVLSLAACQDNQQGNQNTPAPEAVKIGNWAATTEWAAEGEDLKVNSSAGGYACNTNVELEDIFEITTTIDAGAQEAGITLTDKKQNAIVTVRLVFADGKATVVAGYSINDMEKDIFTSDAFAVNGATTLTISKEEGERSLEVVVMEGSKKLLSDSTEEIPSLAARSIKWAGLYGKGTVKFSDISITTEDPSDKYIVGEINPQPHVENENYVFSEGAICNKDAKGNDVIIVDSQTGEATAWNVNYVLGDAWTLKARAQIGQCVDSSGGARFALLGENNALLALITCRVDPVSYTIMFENAQDGTNNWANTAGASKWFAMTSAAFDIVITRHAGENCLYIQIADVTGEVLYAVQTADYPANVINAVKHFGFMVWQTQTQYSNIEVDTENSVDIEIEDKSFIVGITDTQYMEFDRKQSTNAWETVPDVYYQKGSKAGDALLFNVDADATAKSKQPLGSAWKLSMDIRYLLGYAETNHSRFLFYGDDNVLPFLIDMRTLVGTFNFGAQYQHNGAWSDNLFPNAGGTLKEDDIRMEVSRSAGDKRIFIRLLDTDGTVLMEQYTPEIPGIDAIRYLEIHSSETITIIDNIVFE